MMFTFYLLWLSNVSESSKDNFVVTAVSSQHSDLCIFFLLISFLAKIKQSKVNMNINSDQMLDCLETRSRKNKRETVPVFLLN